MDTGIFSNDPEFRSCTMMLGPRRALGHAPGPESGRFCYIVSMGCLCRLGLPIRLIAVVPRRAGRLRFPPQCGEKADCAESQRKAGRAW